MQWGNAIRKSISGISLHTKLIIAFLAIAIIPLLFANIITTHIAEDSVTQSVFEKNQDLANTIAQELNADLEGKIKVMRIAAEDPDIRSMDPERQTRVLQNILAQYPDMGMAAVSAINGTQIGRSDGKPDSSISYNDREYFQELLRTNNTTISDVLKAKSSNLTVIVIAEPIRNDDNSLRGALLVNVQLNQLIARIESTKIGKTGYAFVVNKDGNVIIHPDPLVVSNATNMSSFSPVQSALAGNTGWAKTDLGGKTVLVGYSYVPVNGWGLITVQPLDEALSDVNAIRTTNLIIIACTLIIAFFIILALAGALFRPIALLTAAAETASHGNLTVQARVISTDEIGTLASTFNTMIDRIREREETLKESNLRLENIINFLPDATFVINLEGKVIAWNKATEEITGVKARDILSKGNFEHGLAFYGERKPLLIDTVLGNHNEADRQYMEFKKEGDKVFGTTFVPAVYGEKGAFFLCIASPLYDTKGDVTGAIESMRDITDRKRWEMALIQARSKLDLLNHLTFTDIQNALFSLQGYLELEKSTSEPEKVPEYQSRQMEIIQTITNLLKFAQNYQRLGLKPADWQDVKLQFLFGISHLDCRNLSWSLDVAGLEIYADPYLENIFHSLVENTIVHGGNASKIVLRYQETAEGLTLYYEDNGVGIPADLKESIFEQRYKEMKDVNLFLVREILSITSMTIKETGEPGKGARFEMGVIKGMYRFGGNRDKRDENGLPSGV
jgi:PAS domain S-box-containing protein